MKILMNMNFGSPERTVNSGWYNFGVTHIEFMCKLRPMKESMHMCHILIFMEPMYIHTND